MGDSRGAWLGAHTADEAANEKDFGCALDASRDNNDKHRAWGRREAGDVRQEE